MHNGHYPALFFYRLLLLTHVTAHSFPCIPRCRYHHRIFNQPFFLPSTTRQSPLTRHRYLPACLFIISTKKPVASGKYVFVDIMERRPKTLMRCRVIIKRVERGAWSSRPAEHVKIAWESPHYFCKEQALEMYYAECVEVVPA